MPTGPELTALAALLTAPQAPDEPGALPGGWTVPETEQSTTEAAWVKRRAGAVEVRGSGPFTGGVHQHLPAAELAGRAVRVEASGRSSDGSARIELRAWEDGRLLSARTALFPERWGSAAVTLRVPDQADEVEIALLTRGGERLLVDDVRMGLVEPEEPRPLEGRAMENIEALARLAGYVRWFHPSDEAAEADWGALVVAAVEKVEHAASPEDLAAALTDVFAPVSPTVQVYPTGQPMDAFILPDGEPIGWVHRGVGDYSIYHSERRPLSRVAGGRPAHLWQEVSAEPWRGETISVQARVRLDPGSDAWLLAHTDRDRRRWVRLPDDGAWHAVAVDLEVKEDARSAAVTVQLDSGALVVDDVRLGDETDGTSLPDGDFEQDDGSVLTPWMLAGDEAWAERVPVPGGSALRLTRGVVDRSRSDGAVAGRPARWCQRDRPDGAADAAGTDRAARGRLRDVRRHGAAR